MPLEGTAPLARTTSMSSCAGYHTPIEDEVAGDGVSDLPSDIVPTPLGGSLLNAQVVFSSYFSCCFLILLQIKKYEIVIF